MNGRKPEAQLAPTQGKKTSIATGMMLVLPLALTISACDKPMTGEERAAKIKESCEREYGVNNSDSRSCQIVLMSKVLGEIEDAKFERAKRNSE